MNRSALQLVAAFVVLAGISPDSLARSPFADSTDVRVNAVGGPEYVSYEISVAVSPIDPNFLLIGHNFAPGARFYTSADAGKTWSINWPISSVGTDPIVAISENAPTGSPGRLLVNYLQSVSQILVRYKEGAADAWGQEIYVQNGDAVDKNFLWVDNSPHSTIRRFHQYCAYQLETGKFVTVKVRVRRSTNNGSLWSEFKDFEVGGNGVIVQTGRTGRIYVSWLGSATLQFAESDEAFPDAFFFKDFVSLPTSVVTSNTGFPSMTVDRSDSERDHLYLAWRANSGTDVRIIKGTADFPNADVAWDVQNIGKVNVGTSGPVEFPWITWDECTGMLAVAWLDARDASGRRTYLAVAQTRDANGNFLNANNLSWTETLVSDAPWSSASIPVSGYDYIGIDARDGRAFPVWSDDRTQTMRAYISPILLWGIEQSLVSASFVNHGNGTMTVTGNWSTNFRAETGDRVILKSPNGVVYPSTPCTTCAGADGKTHTVVFAGVPCEPGLWKYTVESRRSQCSQPRTSDEKTFFVPPTLNLTGSWPPSGGVIGKCPAGDPASYNYTVNAAFQGSCVSTVAKARLTLEALPMNPPLRKVAFFPQTVPQPADADVNSGGGYATTITEYQVGGCSPDSARVYLDGVAVGKAYVPFVANYDLNGTGAVDAGDLSLFATSLGFCAPHPNYDPCANFAGYGDCVDPSDLSAFAAHLGHIWSIPQFKSSDTPGSVTRLRVEPGGAAGTKTISVRLEGLQRRSAYGVVLRPTSNARFDHWTPAGASLAGTTAVVDTVDALGRRIAIVAADVQPDAAGNVDLGSLIFRTSSSDVTLEDLPIGFEDVALREAAIASERPAATPMGGAGAQLHPSQPNPFNPRTTIHYSVTTEGEVRIEIFNVAGRQIRTLVSGHHASGDHHVVWDGRDDAGRDVGVGIYVYRLATAGQVETKKLTLVR